MKNFPIDKYKYYVNKNGDTFAVSTFAGKSVVGVSRLHKNDTYVEQTGKELAASKCRVKICEKRLSKATRDYNHAVEQFEYARKHLERMVSYKNDAEDEMLDAIRAKNELLMTL